MTIVFPWNESVESYVDLGENVGYARPAFCPACEHTKLIFWGKRSRFVFDGKKSFTLFVRRMRCNGCGAVHTILPSFLLKRRVHLASLIVSALVFVFIDQAGSRLVADRLGIARSTIRRWIHKFKQSAGYHYRRFLFLKHNLVPQAPPLSAGEIPRAVLDLCREVFLIQAGEKASGATFADWISLATGGCLLHHQPISAP